MINMKLIRLFTIISLSQLLTACDLFDDDNDKTLTPFEGIAAIQSIGDSESHIEFTDGISNIESGFLPQTATDYAVFANGEHFYQLGKYNIDTIQKYHIDNPELGYYPNNGFSLRDTDDTVSANPHQLVFVNESTGVITRYGQTDAWVVNLDATVADDFIIETLDLSQYVTPTSDTDSVPEMDMAFIANDKLFITLQNLEGWTPTENAKVVVFDTNTWEEIDTDSSQDGTQAISLLLKNHQSGALYGDKLYLGSLVYGNSYSDPVIPNTGGIEIIDINNYSVTLAFDDRAVNKIVADSTGNIFFSDYSGWENNTLYKLNSDNSYNIVSNDLDEINITALASPDDTLWLGTNSLDGENKILRLDTSVNFDEAKILDEILLSEVTTAFKPINIAFLDIEAVPTNENEEAEE